MGIIWYSKSKKKKTRIVYFIVISLEFSRVKIFSSCKIFVLAIDKTATNYACKRQQQKNTV